MFLVLANIVAALHFDVVHSLAEDWCLPLYLSWLKKITKSLPNFFATTCWLCNVLKLPCRCCNRKVSFSQIVLCHRTCLQHTRCLFLLLAFYLVVVVNAWQIFLFFYLRRPECYKYCSPLPLEEISRFILLPNFNFCLQHPYYYKQLPVHQSQ